MKGSLVGKVGGAFTSTATQHGGQETTLISFHITLLHQSLVIVGVPYTEQGLMEMDEITGGTPYGASTMAGGDGSRQPSENELAIARFQGRHTTDCKEAGSEIIRPKIKTRSTKSHEMTLTGFGSVRVISWIVISVELTKSL